MRVLKFGGTSMGSAGSWRKIISIADERRPCVLVVSATSGTTNSLIEAAEKAEAGHQEQALEIAESIRQRHQTLLKEFIAAEKLDESRLKPAFDHIDDLIEELNRFLNGIYTVEELTRKTLDSVSSIGERLSSKLLAECMNATRRKACHIDSGQIIKTDAEHGEATPDRNKLKSTTQILTDHCDEGAIPVMGGFYGHSPQGKITTLGRGGSDYSASLVAEAMGANALEVWTDVSGMYTCDPRVVPEAATIPKINFHEAAELAYFGAKVLHPASIQPAVDADIPVWVKNTFDPAHPGTTITSEVDDNQNVKAIAFKRDITLITITSSRMLMAYGFLARVFSVFEQLKLPVDLVTTSEVSVTMSVDRSDNLEELCDQLSSYGEVSVDRHLALLCVVGNNFLKSRGIAKRVFGALADIPVRMISQGSSDMNLSLVISNDKVEDGARQLHHEFFSQNKD